MITRGQGNKLPFYGAAAISQEIDNYISNSPSCKKCSLNTEVDFQSSHQPFLFIMLMQARSFGLTDLTFDHYVNEKLLKYI